MSLWLWTSHDLTVSDDGSLGVTVSLAAGEVFSAALVWSPYKALSTRKGPATVTDWTAEVWRRWMTKSTTMTPPAIWYAGLR
ncbi:hypothetical protein [Rhodococcus sp. 14-2483-1-2]|uniref:hypothetical protein n=1 Tax=Rhodococcus sp. 14-2483-1-2 TaxID=2023147 RepID=UPI00148320A2|nr:hypothetical protein [Rhodococcus sp. 14-2483-1-2]